LTVPDLLGRWELFSHFSEAQLDQLAPCVSLDNHTEGAAILRQGDPTLEAYVVQAGAVRIQRETPYGVFVFAELGAGELFGETSFVDRRVRSVDALAASDCELLRLNPVALSSLMEGDRGLSVALYWTFWKSLSRKLRDTNDKLTRFFSESAPPAEAAPQAGGAPGPDFRVDLDAKRRVFEEQRLSNLEINFLASLSREVKLHPGELIFREGEEGDSLYVVLEGRVMISKIIPGAGEEALAFLERGDYFGEMALIDKQPRSADAKAGGGGAVVLAIPGHVLEGILDIQRVSSLRLLRVLCSMVARRLRELDDKIAGWFMLAGGAVSH
jgi:CRP-like cAMP-binding protein